MKIVTAIAASILLTGLAVAQTPQGEQPQSGQHTPQGMQPNQQGGQGMQGMGHMPPGDMRMRMGMHGDFALMGIERELKMTDGQKKQFTQILAEVDSFRNKTQLENSGNLDRFFTQFKADKMSPDSLKQISKDMEKVYKQTADFGEKKLIEFHDMLTPDQRKNLTKQVSLFIKSRFFRGME